MNEHTHKQKKTDVANRTQTDVWTWTARQWYQEGQGLGGGVDKGVEGTAKDGSSALGGEPASVSAEVRS